MKKYAIIQTVDLKTVKFEHKDDLQDAIISLRGRDKPFLVFKYNEDHGVWTQQEVHTLELNI